jgi:DNA adenine methylase
VSQQSLLQQTVQPTLQPPRGQLLKWVGSKQRFAAQIVAAFPQDFRTYREPFLGGGAVLGTLQPASAVASDVLGPLLAIWQTLQARPHDLCTWYEQRWEQSQGDAKVAEYKAIRSSYNAAPNPADLLFLSRSCYGGVIRFAKGGNMNTPCGAHRPIPPQEFARRVEAWHPRVQGTRFEHADFEQMLDAAQPRDLVYCDPPYTDCESTLYGAQAFSLARLMAAIGRCKDRGVYVALSIDGWKRSGTHACEVLIPPGLFESEARIDVGRSMLRRFQMQGQTLEAEVVADRLLRTWS